MRDSPHPLRAIPGAGVLIAVLLATPGCSFFEWLGLYHPEAAAQGGPDDFPIEERNARVFQHYLNLREKDEFGRIDTRGQWSCRLKGEDLKRFIDRVYRIYGLSAAIEFAILERRLLPGMTEKMAQLSWDAPNSKRKSEDGRLWIWIYNETWDRYGIATPKIYIVFNWHKDPTLRFVQTWHVDPEAAKRTRRN